MLVGRSLRSSDVFESVSDGASGTTVDGVLSLFASSGPFPGSVCSAESGFTSEFPLIAGIMESSALVFGAPASSKSEVPSFSCEVGGIVPCTLSAFSPSESPLAAVVTVSE